MTIRFNCPNCDELIAFADKHSGKRAQCTSCGERFIIPSQDKEVPKKVAPSKEELEPLPGFYRAVFVDGLKLFVKPQNATGLVFISAAVCFKFFAGHTDYSSTAFDFRIQAPTGLVITLAAWGCLFWYYIEIICLAASDTDELPDIDMGGLFGFIGNIIKSLFTFSLALIAVQLPCIIFTAVSENTGIISQILSLFGLFAFPMAILILAIEGDTMLLLRPSYLLRPVAKAFWPYLVVVGLLMLTWQLQLITPEYGDISSSGNFIVGLYLLVKLAVQALAIISMRSIGLFRHYYSCYFSMN
jgi:hypothetical protein